MMTKKEFTNQMHAIDDQLVAKMSNPKRQALMQKQARLQTLFEESKQGKHEGSEETV